MRIQLPVWVSLWCLMTLASAQVDVHGVVKSSRGEVLPQVQVERVGGKQSTLTDSRGTYQLSVPDTLGELTFRFSLAGMEPQEVKSRGGKLDVTLKPTTGQSSPDNVNTASRGATSIYGNTKPLWVLDGVILEGNIDISLEDLASPDAKNLIARAVPGVTIDNLASFKVLRDAASTSIYGSRAIAGVVSITTKKGSSGSNSLSYTGEFTYRPIPSYRDFNVQNSQQHISVLQDVLNSGGTIDVAHSVVARTTGAIAKMYELFSTEDTNGNPVVSNTLEGRTKYLQMLERRNTDWFGALFQNSIQHKHTVNFSSGTSKATYFASASVLFDPGWSIANKQRQYSASLNVNYKIYSKLSFNLISNATYDTQHFGRSASNNKFVVESQSVTEATGEPSKSSSSTIDPVIAAFSMVLNTPRTMSPDEDYTREYGAYAPRRELRSSYMDVNTTDFKLQGQLTWKPLKQLSVIALAAFKHQGQSRAHTLTDGSYLVQAYRAASSKEIEERNPYLYKDPNNPYAIPITLLPQGGLRNKEDQRTQGHNFRISGSYNDSFAGGKHVLSALVGSELSQTDKYADWHRDYGVLFDQGYLPAFSEQLFHKLVQNNETYYTITTRRERLVSFFGNASYSFLGRYTLEGTLRYDGSNRYGAAKTSARWLPNWNLGLEWNAGMEKFFPRLGGRVLSSLVLKASYGLTSDNPSVSNVDLQYAPKQPWRGSATSPTGLDILSLANEDLTYEKTYELNLSAKAAFFKGRIGVGATVYHRDHRDLVGTALTEGTSGLIERWGNVASMESDGVELSLNTTNIRTEDFRWTTSLSYNHRTNKITKLYTEPKIEDMVKSSSGFSLQGYSKSALFSIPFAGLTTGGLPTFYDQSGGTTISGIAIDSHDVGFLRYSGTTTPTDLGGIGNTFKYKNLSLSIYLSYAWGNVVRLRSMFKANYSDSDLLGREFANRWQQPGDELLTVVPKIASYLDKQADSNLDRAYQAYNYSDARIAKGDYLRLRDIYLSYSFDKDVARKLGLKALSLKLQGSNLLLIYADKRLNGADPAYSNYTPKRVTLTVNVGL